MIGDLTYIQVIGIIILVVSLVAVVADVALYYIKKKNRQEPKGK